MKTTDKEAISQEDKSILQLERQLLPIDKYALREGLSTDMVEHFSKIGYLQIRKCKGKIYVVDVPVSQYNFDAGSEGSAQFDFEAIETNERTEPQQESSQNSSDTTLESFASKAARIHEPLKRIFDKAYDIVHKPQKAGSRKPVRAKSDKHILTEDAPSNTDEMTPLEKHADPIHTPELEKIVIGPSVEAKPTLQAPQTFADSEIQFELLTAEAQAKRSWQIAAISLTTILFIAVFITIWSLSDRKAQVNKANQAYAGMYQLVNDSSREKQQSQLLKDELNISEATIDYLRSELKNSTAEVKRLQNETDASRADVKLMRNKLNRAKQIHDALQEKNAKALKELTEQFQNLKSRLSEMLQLP